MSFAPRTSRRAMLATGILLFGYLLVDVVGGAPRSPVVPVFPAGLGPPVWTERVASWLGLAAMSRLALTLLVLALLAILVAAFVVLLHEAWQGRVGLSWAIEAAVAAIAVAVAGPLLLSRDVYSYAAYGRIFAIHGSNPYVRPPAAFPQDPFTPVVSSLWLRTRSLYGPAFLLPAAAIGRVWSRSPAGTVLAFRLLSGGALAMAAWLAAVATRFVRPGRESLAAAAVGLNPVVVLHTVGGGHNDALIAALLAGAFALGARWWRDPPRGPTSWMALGVTALLTLAVLIKVVVGPPLLLWGWSVVVGAPAGKRARVAAAHGGVVLLIAAALFAPFVAGSRTIAPLVTLAARQGWASGPGMVARSARGLGNAMAGRPGGVVLATMATGLFLAAYALLLWRLLQQAPRRSPPLSWGPALLLLCLALPYLVPWYAAWFLPFVAVMLDGGLGWVALTAAGVLALTGVPAEPASAPGLWRDMLLGVHYGAASIMLGLFLVAARLALRSTKDGALDRDQAADGSAGAIVTSRSAKARA